MNAFQAREIWPPGTVVDRKYLIQSTIGRGGFGTVYLATHRVLGHEYVIKRLHSQFAENNEFIHKFVKEAQAIAKLKGCPQIVEVFDMTQTEDGHLILVMEHVPGGDLAAFIHEQGKLSVEDTIWYGLQIALALKAAHARGFVHRDVKPQNVLLGADRKVAKLTDFGIVAQRDLEQATSLMRGGSAGYASPEQWRFGGKYLDGRADLYSLGVTMYYMLTGRLPYGELDLTEWAAAVQAGPPAPIRNVRRDVPEDLDRLVLEMLEFDRDKRPNDVGAVIERLQRCMAAPASTAVAAAAREETIVEVPQHREASPAIEPAPKPAELFAIGSTGSATEHSPRRWLAIGAVILAAVGSAGWWGWTRMPAAMGPAAADATPASETTKPARIPVPAGVQVQMNSKDGLEYVFVPPGSFRMGCSDAATDCADDEKPAHEVRITKGFWMGETEVTTGAYKKFVASTGRSMPHIPNVLGIELNPGWADDLQPFSCATWTDAKEYCAWAGRLRLPTEAEWEYAARAGTTTATYGPIRDIAWFNGNSPQRPRDVGLKQPNAFGLYDMLGNVPEFTADWYGETYYSSRPSIDPKGPANGQLRVKRGGSWFDYSFRVSARGSENPEDSIGATGFRCSGLSLNP